MSEKNKTDKRKKFAKKISKSAKATWQQVTYNKHTSQQ